MGPGIYAVQVFQDRNSNGKLDRGFLGVPRGPFSFRAIRPQHGDHPSSKAQHSQRKTRQWN
ncbi:DUF2141 domain-containing protein [Gluconobacter morbifer]|uniref:DUF2141 domain-containing protein n=1 Tax=Gluconobacter morbifer TaxID=479935 RepID=UPI001112C485